MLHQVGVLFDLYYDARKHKIKICALLLPVGFLSSSNHDARKHELKKSENYLVLIAFPLHQYLHNEALLALGFLLFYLLFAHVRFALEVAIYLS